MKRNEEVLSRLSELFDEETAFIGLGNMDRGDDAAGLLIVDTLSREKPGHFYSERQGLEADILDLIKRSRIGRMIFVDSSDFRAQPGEFRLFRREDIEHDQISSHKIPLSIYAALLEMSGKEIFILGIQPKSLEYGTELSDEVTRAISEIEKTLRARLTELS